MEVIQRLSQPERKLHSLAPLQLIEPLLQTRTKMVVNNCTHFSTETVSKKLNYIFVFQATQYLDFPEKDLPCILRGLENLHSCSQTISKNSLINSTMRAFPNQHTHREILRCTVKFLEREALIVKLHF